MTNSTKLKKEAEAERSSSSVKKGVREPVARESRDSVEPSMPDPSTLDTAFGLSDAASDPHVAQPSGEIEEVREPLIDVFDEGDHVLVVAELPGVELSDVRLELCDDILLLSAKSADCLFRQEVYLPASVVSDGRSEKLRNGVYELKLFKARAAGA